MDSTTYFDDGRVLDLKSRTWSDLPDGLPNWAWCPNVVLDSAVVAVSWVSEQNRSFAYVFSRPDLKRRLTFACNCTASERYYLIVNLKDEGNKVRLIDRDGKKNYVVDLRDWSVDSSKTM